MRRGSARGITNQVWWPWLKRVATAIFFMLVAGMLVIQARTVEWGEVFTTLANYPLPTLLGAVMLAMLSLTLYSSFDLVGRRYTGHTLPAPTVMRITFISYVFNLNLGSLVGGIAMRYRLYSRAGLSTGVITRIMSMSMLSNWIGYVLLAGAIFGFYAPALPSGWAIGNAGLRIVGFVLLTLSMAYLLLCAMSRQRSYFLRGHEMSLPSLPMAALQFGMGAANWLLMGGIVFTLLQQRIGFLTVVGVLLVGAIAGVIARIPAGLGVLEAVFVVLLSHHVPKHELLAALLAYRLIYYLAPLGLGVALYLAAELRSRRRQN